MRATLLGVPLDVGEELERRLREECGREVPCLRQALDGAPLPDVFRPGLLVLWDGGGPLEALVAQVRRVHARRALARTQLVVLTPREPSQTRALAEAGADECLAPPGAHWGARCAALGRRLVGAEGNAWHLELRSEPQRVQPEDALAELLASTSAEIGPGFFRALMGHLTRAFRVSCAFVAELLPDRQHMRMLASSFRGEFHEGGMTLPLAGTPCEDAVAGGICHCPDGAAERFPADVLLQQYSMRGYLGMALRGARGDVIGLVALAHDQPLLAGPLDYALLDAFAARAGAELERLRVQAELEHARDFLRHALDGVPDPLFVRDREHRWVVVNAAFCRFMGREPHELLGRRAADFLPPDAAEAFSQHDERAFTTGQTQESERTLPDAEGRPRTLYAKKAVFTGSDGAPYLVAGIRDVTERKRLEEQLRLADRMASVGTLAAGVAHEINNPLAYVCGNLAFLRERLAQPRLPEEDRADMLQAATEALEGGGRVRAIVRDLRTFARADEERFGPVDVRQVMDGALRLVRNEMQHRARLEREDAPVPAVLGNEVRLGQVLVNLLVNALQAFPERPAADNRLRVATRPGAPGWVEVEVEDNGCGMSPEVQQRIFDPFFTTKPVGEGTGLGLSICHTLVQAMGGRIEVRSAPGRGSTFRVVLPAVVAPQQPAPVAREGEAPPERRARLLLVDDEPSVGSAVRRLLSGVHEVDVVRDAREALRRVVAGGAYDAVLCDVMMPGMDGMEFVAELERVAPALARRTGFMTGGAFTPSATGFLAARSHALLEKPFGVEGLRSFIAGLLR